MVALGPVVGYPVGWRTVLAGNEMAVAEDRDADDDEGQGQCLQD
jgi:hypothetical protein